MSNKDVRGEKLSVRLVKGRYVLGNDGSYLSFTLEELNAIMFMVDVFILEQEEALDGES